MLFHSWDVWAFSILFLLFLQRKIIFSLTIQIYKKSFCTTPGVGIGGDGGGCGIGKMLSFTFKFFLCERQGAVRQARPQGYKTFSMLNSVEHEILNAHKYKNIKNFGFD